MKKILLQFFEEVVAENLSNKNSVLIKRFFENNVCISATEVCIEEDSNGMEWLSIAINDVEYKVTITENPI